MEADRIFIHVLWAAVLIIALCLHHQFAYREAKLLVKAEMTKENPELLTRRK